MSVLPIYHVIALPGAKLWLRQEFYRQQTGKTASVGDKVTVLFQKDQLSRSELTGDSFYNICPAANLPGTAFTISVLRAACPRRTATVLLPWISTIV